MSLYELEEIKSNRNKADDVKYKARQATHWLAEHFGGYEVVCDAVGINGILSEFGAEDNADSRICASAILWQRENQNPVEFITYDICCRVIAEEVFGLHTKWVEFEQKGLGYSGFKEVVMSEEQMAYFYEHQDENMYDLLVNEYIIVKDLTNKIVDCYRWTGESYQALYKKGVKSAYFDKLKPKDIYQSCVIDSIMNNTITAIQAPAGAGKSLLSLMAAMNLIENGKYDRLVILYNPTKTKGAFDMGYYSGDAIEKGLQQFLGNMLATKFGDQFGVELLIQQGKLKIVSLADCRGMEVRDNEILYMTECQNTTIELMKIALSRVSAGAKVIIEGDYKAQVDSYLFNGNNNGLRRVIEAFKGNEDFGYVELQNVWRSKLAQMAELL